MRLPFNQLLPVPADHLFYRCYISGSLLAYINRVILDVKCHLLTLLERLEAVTYDCGEMNENICPLFVIVSDKAVTLNIIKPSYCTVYHLYYPFLIKFSVGSGINTA